MKQYYCHPTAEVAKSAIVGKGTKIWHFVQIGKKASVGRNSVIGKNVYIDKNVTIGNNCKIQNNVSIYHGSTIGNGVFIGPHVVLTNDRYPRAINKFGRLKKTSDWKVEKILVEDGASIGACSVILPGVTIGKNAMIGAGSVVTKNVRENGLVYGNPAKKHGEVNNNEK